MKAIENQIYSQKLFSTLLIFLLLFISADLFAQFFDERPSQRKLPEIEFLGWNYAEVGYALGPGEKVKLLFRNNTTQQQKFPVNWILKTYTGESLTAGETELQLDPGETGELEVKLPKEMKDGPYNILYTPKAVGWNGSHLFYFDYRGQMDNKQLNLNLVAHLENMDAEGWARMMLGPLSKFINIQKKFPQDYSSVDAAIVIAEALDFFNPVYAEIENYVRKGGKIIVFGKTAPVLFKMLPVENSAGKLVKNKPVWLKSFSSEYWPDFQSDSAYLHYPVQIVAKRDAQVIAKWSDDTPAVVEGQYGKGQVIYISTGSFQVWNNNQAFLGTDELLLRILYKRKGGETAVNAMLSYVNAIYEASKKEDLEIRDRVFDGLEIKKPEEFMVLSKNNMGRFGWLTSEGGLTENIEGNCNVTPVRTQDTYNTIPYHVFDFSFEINNQNSPEPSKVEQNWFAKKITWQYAGGEQIRSTLSLGTPAILWEGKSTQLHLKGSDFTHVAYPVKNGVKIIAKGEDVDTKAWSENWLLTFMAKDSVRDMPQLIVFTSKPKTVQFNDGVNFIFGNGGFNGLFTSRLFGIQRLAPGKTVAWAKQLPVDAIKNASRWSRTFLYFPENCEEIGWIENDQVKFADKFYFRQFDTDWNTQPLKYTLIPPIYGLGKSVGAPIHLPEQLDDLNCPTKYGPMLGLQGNSSLIGIDLPHMDHRAVVPVEGKMVLEQAINRNVAGIAPNSLTYNDQLYDHNGGEFTGDLLPYEISHEVPYYEAPQLDLYKWWLTFNAITARPVYNDSVKNVVDKHFETRYWETLNFYPHKSLLMRKREPWTGIEYMTTFVWPTNTRYGWRYTGDVQESSAVNTYAYATYARYYGDWTTIKANWNVCREIHDFLTDAMDWAALSTGAGEYWNATGIDMANSEPYGRLAFAFAAENAGYKDDALRGKIGGTRSLVTAVARLALEPYIYSITTEGDLWRSFTSFNFFNEYGMQLTKGKRGGIGWLDTSKGAMHELALAYKMWAPQAMDKEQKAIAATSRFQSLCDLTQRLILGWNSDSLLNQVIDNPRFIRKNPTSFNDAAGLYDMAVLCIGNLPVFLSDWAPAEYVSGSYNEEDKLMKLSFVSHLEESFTVKIYSQFQPLEVKLNGNPIQENWDYNPENGWLKIALDGKNPANVELKLGQAVAPLHPYFSGIIKE